MIRNTVLVLCFVASTFLAAPPSDAAPAADSRSGVKAFVDVTVIPMDRERTILKQTVIVRDGVIAQIGPAGSVTVPDGAVRIEGQGGYLMPGLAEMHAHVPPGTRPPQQDLEDLMFLYIANGVTSIRGMLGADYQLAMRQELASGALLGPTIYVGAPSLNGKTAPTPEIAEKLVREYKSAGYDLLKIHPGLTLPTWDRLIATANEVKITLAGHIPEAVGLRHALETGMQCVDHLDGYMEGSYSDANIKRLKAGEKVPPAELVAAIDKAKLDGLVRLTIERHVFNTPTLYVWQNLVSPVDTDRMLQGPEMKYISAKQRQEWRETKRRYGAKEPADAKAIVAFRSSLLKKLHDAGVPILMGTDSPQIFNVPGFSLQHELKLMEAAGLTRFAVLESGTRNVSRYAGEVLGIESNFGTVAVGNRADLVLLAANPLQSLDNLTRRRGVMVRGRWVPAKDIEQGLADLAARSAAAR